MFWHSLLHFSWSSTAGPLLNGFAEPIKLTCWILAGPTKLPRWVLAGPIKLQCWILAGQIKLQCWILAGPIKLQCWILAGQIKLQCWILVGPLSYHAEYLRGPLSSTMHHAGPIKPKKYFPKNAIGTTVTYSWLTTWAQFRCTGLRKWAQFRTHGPPHRVTYVMNCLLVATPINQVISFWFGSAPLPGGTHIIMTYFCLSLLNSTK
jgi:hypothetical protein